MSSGLAERARSEEEGGPRSPEVLFEEARRRRRRRWQAGSTLAAVAAGVAWLIVGLAGGGGGGSGSGTLAQPSGATPPGGGGFANASRVFVGAPVTQSHVNLGTDYCALAPRSKYLPRLAGCVTVRRVDLSGNGQRDLVLVYSRLSRRHVPFAGLRNDHYAERAMLRVVEPDGRTITTPIAGSPVQQFDHKPVIRVAAPIAAAHVNDEPGDELFLQVGQIAGEAAAVPYGLHDNRLIYAGVEFGYQGDGGAGAGFDCVAGTPPRVVWRSFMMSGQSATGIWKVRQLTYAWHGARLVKVAQRTFTRTGAPVASEQTVGAGCINGIA